MHSKLGSATRFACDRFDFDRSGFHLGNFLSEEVFDKCLICTAQYELRSTIIALNVFYEHFDSRSDTIEFTLYLLALWNDTDCLTQFDTYDTRLDTLHDTGYDGADFVFIFLKHYFTFSFTESLQDYLLSCLSSHSAERCDFV